MIRHRYKPGYSLVELLLFMALSGIFLAISAQLLQTTIDYKLETTGSAAVDLSGNYMFRRLLYDLRRTSTISTPNNPGETSDALTLVIGGVNYSYSLNSGRLILVTAGNTEPISDSSVSVRNFVVTRTGVDPQPTGVTISFEVESLDKTTGNVAQTRSWQFSYILR